MDINAVLFANEAFYHCANPPPPEDKSAPALQ